MLDLLDNLVKSYGLIIAFVVIVVLVMITILKKYCEKYIDKIADKELKRYSNVLNRRTMAYEMLFKKEFDFYNEVNRLIGDFIVDVQDVVGEFETWNDGDLERYKILFKRFCSNTLQLKNLLLVNQIYVPEEIFESVFALVGQLQESIKVFGENSKLVGKIERKIIQIMHQKKDDILMSCAGYNVLVKQHLDLISKEE